MQRNAEKAPKTLEDTYQLWLSSKRRNGEGMNSDRTPAELMNFKRALACLAAAEGDGESDLAKLPASLLRISDDLVRRKVAIGATLLADQHRRRVPSDKTISNLASCVRAIQKAAFDGIEKRLSIRELVATKVKSPMAGRQGVRRFYFKDLPEGFKGDWAAYRAWKMTDFLPSSEQRFRKKTCNARSLDTHRRRITTYASWLRAEKGIDDLRLEELCDRDNYIEFLNWYLNRGTNAGYNTARDTGTTLATISQFLVAKGRIDELLDGKAVWNVFYEMSAKPMELGARRGHLAKPRDPDAFTVRELLLIARQGWDSEPVHRGTPHGQRHDAQLIGRKRSALLLRLAVEAPVRLRNWREMQWGKNLYRDKKGRWTVSFEGQELKVANRGPATNVYTVTFSDEAGTWIDRWREELRKRLGEDFEQKCPYVFPPAGLKPKPCHEDTLRSYVRGLALEITGKDLNPHLFRHIVATHVMRNSRSGLDGANLAAKLLGNTREVVIRTYASENTDEAHGEYLKQLMDEDGD